MSKSTLFPQGLATGEAFCNREETRAKLEKSFINQEHTVIIAPRRYGKTSLIHQTLLDANIPGRRIDLLPATDIEFVHRAIRACVSELINEIAPKTKQARQKIVDFIKSLHPKLILNLLGQHLEITTPKATESSLIELLTGLNAVAEKTKTPVVLCCDEFQQISSFKNYHSVEASIRHAVEASTYVTYIFSGSSRHLLNQMFSSKSRPLYRLCNLLNLERIPEATYHSILYKRAIQHWGEISKDAVEEILSLTECHSYHVNGLCRLLWEEKKAPDARTVQKIWYEYLESQMAWVTQDLSLLSRNQLHLLIGLYLRDIKEPFSNESVTFFKMNASSIKKTLEFLLKQDWVYKKPTGEYGILDPAVMGYLEKTAAIIQHGLGLT